MLAMNLNIQKHNASKIKHSYWDIIAWTVYLWLVLLYVFLEMISMPTDSTTTCTMHDDSQTYMPIQFSLMSWKQHLRPLSRQPYQLSISLHKSASQASNPGVPHFLIQWSAHPAICPLMCALLGTSLPFYWVAMTLFSLWSFFLILA